MSDLTRVEDLAQRVADGLADEAVITELEELMKEDPSARILYLQTLQLHQDLERRSEAEPSGSATSSSPSPEPLPITSSRRTRRVLLAAAAALVLSLVGGWIWLTQQEPFALITRLDQVEESFRYHQILKPGDQISIRSGFLELTYRNGARVVLEGPANYTLEDSMHGRLELGSLAAEVPPGASGFTIVTPSAEVEDIGTHFAVALLETGRTELEVFGGEVRAKSALAKSTAKSVTTGESAAVDDGETEVESIPTNSNRFSTVREALNRRTIEATADRFVQGGRHADLAPIDSPDVLLLKQLGSKSDVARKVWIRFDLSDEPVDPSRPATLTVHTAKDLSRESWQVQLFALKAGFLPTGGVQGTDWKEESLTWNSAPGNDTASPVGMNSSASLITSTEIRVSPDEEPAGTRFTITIPSLQPFLQDDGTVTLMLTTRSGRHKVLNLSAREHEIFAGPLLTFETSEE